MDAMPTLEETLRRPLYFREKLYYAIITLAAPILLPLVFFYYLFNFHITAFSIGLMISFYILTGLGITIGYHRLLTPRSFQANNMPPTWLSRVGIA